jgi:hypothetical protein
MTYRGGRMRRRSFLAAAADSLARPRLDWPVRLVPVASRKTAKAIGREIAQSILVRADEVIE